MSRYLCGTNSALILSVDPSSTYHIESLIDLNTYYVPTDSLCPLLLTISSYCIEEEEEEEEERD